MNQASRACRASLLSATCAMLVGDVRHGSMKRLAAAVGEGASAVRSVHTAIGVRA